MDVGPLEERPDRGRPAGRLPGGPGQQPADDRGPLARDVPQAVPVPDWSWHGIRPTYRPTALASGNRCGPSTNAATASAARAPSRGLSAGGRQPRSGGPGGPTPAGRAGPGGRASRPPRGGGPAAARGRGRAAPVGGPTSGPPGSTARGCRGGVTPALRRRARRVFLARVCLTTSRLRPLTSPRQARTSGANRSSPAQSYRMSCLCPGTPGSPAARPSKDLTPRYGVAGRRSGAAVGPAASGKACSTVLPSATRL